ncbi:putative metal-binding protein [Palleronia aestuarii]|uniref:Putative metal-binding protein n=1 Tax=Palleronia aestuarii TaxID=568105 RepID=A0A2W7NGV4_9RHOB|nr:DUF1636 domain-containing protein [Palleronia aestuarii]PZX19090.1 putative metal-binding protein [Palleronia aestuarii]
MTTWITICDTCKRDDWSGGDTDGERLAALIEAEAEGSDLRTRRFSCLMGCSRACNVALQSQGKLAYTLGEFTPDREAARAIVDYARLHAESRTGQVPYRAWPEPIKGHFVTRHTPLPEE